MIEHFSEAEARSLVGREFAVLHGGYARIPKGTIGRVTGIYRVGRDAWSVEVTWQGIEGHSPLDKERGGLTDGFSKRDLEIRFPDGRRAMTPVEELVRLEEAK